MRSTGNAGPDAGHRTFRTYWHPRGMSSRSKQYDRFTGFIVKDSTPRANKISRTSSLTSLARIWSVRRSAPLAFFVTVSSSPASASSSSRSRDSIVPSASSKTSGLGTTNMHRCMPETTAHADTVSPSTLDASTGTRPKRNTVPGCAMSSCASRKKKGSVESESSGREPSASCAGAASTATSSPAASSHTAAHPSAAPSSVDAAATAAPDAVTPAAGGAGARTVVSLRIPVFLAIAAAAAGLGGSSSSSSSSSSIGTGADASSASAFLLFCLPFALLFRAFTFVGAPSSAIAPVFALRGRRRAWMAIHTPDSAAKALDANGGMKRKTCSTTIDQESYCEPSVLSPPVNLR